MTRVPAKSKMASEIVPGNERVKVLGTLVSIAKDKKKVVVDDGGASVEIQLNSLDLVDKLSQYRPGDQVMVIGWTSKTGIDGEILRKISGFDPSRYKQVLEVWKNARSEDGGPETASRSSEGRL
ncbi:MAG: hypothetical protein GOV01_02720 [Candidatus Altiarchaeota archaeon]|nr:hypothetical protein [Candidatus Altiarchaeota archaeon]